MRLQRLDQPRRRRRRTVDSRKKRVAICADERHALVFFEDAPRALVGKVARSQSGHRNGLPDHFLG